MEVRRDEGVREVGYSLTGPRLVLVLTGAVFLLAAVALMFNCIDAAAGTSATFPSYENGWSVGSMVLMLTGRAIYLPGVLLGVAALGLAQSKATREHATRMARPLLVLGAVVIVAGIARAVCEVGSHYCEYHGTLGWFMAQTSFRLLGRSLLEAGILAGLAYLCRQRVGSATLCEKNKPDSEG